MVPMRMRLGVGLTVLLCSCAQAPPPPPALPFAQSEAYHSVRQSLAGFLKRDLDHDGFPEIVGAQRIGPGFAPVVFWRDVKTNTWHRGCQGPVAAGEDLDALRWVRIGGVEHLLLLASESDPEEQVQSLVLVDPAAGCKAVYRDRVRVVLPGFDVVAPGSVPAGVTIGKNGVGIQIVDQPKFVRLQGADGDVQLLVSVRRRLLGQGPHGITAKATAVGFLTRRKLTVRWQGSGANAGVSRVLPELVDGDDSTGFAARAGEAGELILSADAPVVMVELHHGCLGAPHVPLKLGVAGTPYVTGTAPARGGAVRASGRSHADAAGHQRDLLVLRRPVSELHVALGADATERCLREVRAYGFVGAKAVPPAKAAVKAAPIAGESGVDAIVGQFAAPVSR